MTNLDALAAALHTILADRLDLALERWLTERSTGVADADLMLGKIDRYTDSTHDELLAAVDRVRGDWPDHCVECGDEVEEMSPESLRAHVTRDAMVLGTCTGHPNA